jgi:hypothetical protein
MLVGGLPFSINLPIGQCVVPQGINGPVAIWITSDSQPLNGNVVDRASNAIVAGPLLTFVDVQSDLIGTLVRNSSNPLPPPSTTQTVSLAQVSSAPSTSAASSPSGAVIVNGISLVPAPSSTTTA